MFWTRLRQEFSPPCFIDLPPLEGCFGGGGRGWKHFVEQWFQQKHDQLRRNRLGAIYSTAQPPLSKFWKRQAFSQNCCWTPTIGVWNCCFASSSSCYLRFALGGPIVWALETQIWWPHLRLHRHMTAHPTKRTFPDHRSQEETLEIPRFNRKLRGKWPKSSEFPLDSGDFRWIFSGARGRKSSLGRWASIHR